jgi:hypothetical protein
MNKAQIASSVVGNKTEEKTNRLWFVVCLWVVLTLLASVWQQSELTGLHKQLISETNERRAERAATYNDLVAAKDHVNTLYILIATKVNRESADLEACYEHVRQLKKMLEVVSETQPGRAEPPLGLWKPPARPEPVALLPLTAVTQRPGEQLPPTP